jgi:hypothetical protein
MDVGIQVRYIGSGLMEKKMMVNPTVKGIAMTLVQECIARDWDGG